MQKKIVKHLSSTGITQIEDSLNWQYPYKLAENIPTKSSVSKIKNEHAAVATQKFKNTFLKYNQINEKKGLIEFLKQEDDEQKSVSGLAIPKFEEEEKITGAAKGTLIHLCFKNIDEKKEYTFETLKELVEDLKNRKIITQKEAEAIPINVLLKYTKSNLFMDLKGAKEVHKEEPFYINIPANQIYEETPELQENILVQGIIDLYYIDKNGKIILVDYKTDYVEDEKELIEKYSEQLNLYKDAIQRALNKKVDKTIIYSTYLQKEIELK